MLEDVPVLRVSTVVVCVQVLVREFLQLVETPVITIEKKADHSAIRGGLSHVLLYSVKKLIPDEARVVPVIAEGPRVVTPATQQDTLEAVDR